MERIGADYDIHLIWDIKELINKIGPEKAIRELKKRCEAGAIIGCTLYKRMIEHWLGVAMHFEDKAGRGPAEEFMEAAGEDDWVRRVEELHEKYPEGIPRSKRLDLIDEFNAELERRVGRRIPLEPGDASEEDIKESKRIAGQMARHEKVMPPKPEVKPEVKAERPKPELKPTIERAPMEPVILVPEKPAAKPPELDLMKREIEERIAKMKAEKARGELKAGESNKNDKTQVIENPDIWIKSKSGSFQIISGHGKYPRHSIVALDKAGYTIGTIDYSIDEKNKKKINIENINVYPEYRRQGYATALLAKLKKHMPNMVIDWGAVTIDGEELKNSQRILSIDMIAEGISKLSREERVKIARSIIATMQPHVEKKEELVENIYTKVIEIEKEKGKIEYFSLEDIAKLPKEKRLELARKITRGEIALVKETSAAMRKNHPAVREDTDILTEPRDYSQWTFADFEGMLPGLEDVEDLEELREQVGASGVMSDSDKEIMRNLITQRIDELKRIYIEW